MLRAREKAMPTLLGKRSQAFVTCIEYFRKVQNDGEVLHDFIVSKDSIASFHHQYKFDWVEAGLKLFVHSNHRGEFRHLV